MEALTAVSVAALTIYDMCKAVDKQMQLTNIRLTKKTGGRSGGFRGAMIRVKYFASLRERMNRGEDQIEVSDDQLTLADVLARLTLPDGQTLQQLSLGETMMLSVNHEMVGNGSRSERGR